ncbi:hypothetical protein ACWOC1_07790 [Enterococcus quebecensis]|uniref:Uncharacterized protein n=1 Tax=Enterococcus quebecensis TaxID=903983 RepID=A0A1E5GUJ8_9ENTE|nr:hypothetical protein [Enterococcus quebecensis]OEG16363.1 hypothetical protein BCR23_05595 [Enterococcus quebecensis]OJG72766.1 hypothetical protein RV12_GL000864 [Enterococcus quebecensis]
MLELLDIKLDGSSWEDLCVKCCRLRFQNEHFQEVPAYHKGDGGIEGFTKTGEGIVIQCYCPDDPNLSINQLYEAQRDKMTEDINKFVENHKVLKKIGLCNISKWLFMVPTYKDRRILEHITKKEKFVLSCKKNKPSELSYISDDFQIIIKVASDFKVEMAQMIRLGITDVKLDTAISEEVDWNDVESEKLENVKRKIRAISPEISQNKDRENRLLDIQMKRYVSGNLEMEYLGEEFPDIRDDIYKITTIFKNRVEEETLMNSDSSLNNEVYKKLSKEYGEVLENSVDYLTPDTIMRIQDHTVAKWLADCSMEFYGGSDKNEEE